MQHDEQRWFHVAAAMTYQIGHFVQAANREDALKTYHEMDLTDEGHLMDETILEIEECEDPTK